MKRIIGATMPTCTCRHLSYLLLSLSRFLSPSPYLSFPLLLSFCCFPTNFLLVLFLYLWPFGMAIVVNSFILTLKVSYIPRIICVCFHMRLSWNVQLLYLFAVERCYGRSWTTLISEIAAGALKENNHARIPSVDR